MKRLMLAAALAFALPALASAEDATGSADAGGHYTIVRRTDGDVQTGNDTRTAIANRNADPAAIRRTIAANPGLDAALAENGVETTSIRSISVEPTGRVIVYTGVAD